MPGFKLDCGPVECIPNRFGTAAEMTSEERFHDGAECQAVFLSDKTMAFISEGRISDGYGTLTESLYDLFRLLRSHPNVVPGGDLLRVPRQPRCLFEPNGRSIRRHNDAGRLLTLLLSIEAATLSRIISPTAWS